MKLHLPTYMGGQLVELATSGIASDEEIVGWVDDYGTIKSSKANIVIGDLVQVEGQELRALIMKK